MIFDYGGKRLTGSRAEILKRLETAFSAYVGINVSGYESIHLGEESCPIDIMKRNLIKSIQNKVPRERTAEIIGDEIFIKENGIFIKRINIYDI